MYVSKNSSRNCVKSLLMGSTLLAGAAVLAVATGAAYAQDSAAVETVTVTGYRASLQSSTFQKKEAVSFTESVFAEDIGKFPDTNLAEALNRIPGITLVRDITGEGVNISIRGLGTNFTKMTLNNAAIAIATTGATDYANNNREVDLNMFPSELFTQLQVDKSPRAELLEGGAAGNVNMRTRRPFDNPGLHVTYTAQGIDNSISNGFGGNGALVVSDTWETGGAGEFGILVGIAGKRAYNYVHGWEDGNAGWNTPTINNSTLCGATSGCDISGTTVSIGSDNMTIPATIPNNISIPGFSSYTAGTTVDSVMLLALNPSMNMTQLSNMLLPRLSRDMYERGTRDRYNGVMSLEWKPTENLHFYLDAIVGRQFNDQDRNDLDLGVRGGNSATPMIPVGASVDSNYVVQKVTLYNATWGLEARHYLEKGDFWSINPGMEWKVTDLLDVSLQFNASRSHFLRSSPTVMFSTCSSDHTNSSYGATTGYCAAPTGGVYAVIDNTHGETYPRVTSNLDWNDPDNYQWGKGRVNMQSEKRYTDTYGVHLDVKYGGEEFAVRAGFSYDDIFRGIAAIDGSKEWTIDACGNNDLDGKTYTTCYGGANSLIPQSAVSSYLSAGPNGYVKLDYDKFMADSNFNSIYNTAWSTVNSRCKGTTSMWYSTSSNTSGTSGCYDERYIGLYGQVDGVLHVGDRDLNYDVGLRWVETHQTVISPTLASSSTTVMYDSVSLGTVNYYNFAAAKQTYQAFLPSASIVYHVADDFLVRASVSRTMTRPDVSKMNSVVSFSDTQASTISLGNPELKPYFSNNIDIGVEYYTGGEGYISFTAFNKYISGFYTSKSVTKTFGYLAQWGIVYTSISDQQRINLGTRGSCNSQDTCANTSILVTQNVNSPGIETIDGLEFGYVQPLDFLLEKYGVKGLGVTANLTIVDQSSSGSAATHATGVAPYTYNLTGYYENNGIMARMSYVFTARTYASGSYTQSVCVMALPSAVANSTTCTTGAYLFSSPYGQADFSSSLNIAKVFDVDLPSDPEITLSVQNVFNAKQRSYFQYENAAHSYYVKGQTIMFGLHGSF
jgi:TonB-dependent receptor